MKKVIVSVTNDLATDNRVNRTCLLLLELGYDVTLVGRLRKNSLSIGARSYKTKRFRLLFNKGPLFYAEINIRLFFFLIFRKVDLLFSNDLDTLSANYLVNKLKTKSKLIYDTHELFTEVPELKHRKFVRNVWLMIEKYIFPKLEYIITVNQSIAEIYFKKYKKSITVVRNTPERRIEKSDATRFSLGLPIDKFIMIIQGSGLNVERGIEEVILAMHMIENSVLLIFGSGDIIPKAKELVKSEKLEAKVLFFNQRPYLEMMKFTMNSDIGLAIDKPDCDNYKFSLPNKVFDYIQARIPILWSQLFEVKKLIEQYDIGCSISSVNPKEIAEKVNFLLENPQILSQYKINCIKAAEIENWQNEKLKLKELILQSEKI